MEHRQGVVLSKKEKRLEKKKKKIEAFLRVAELNDEDNPASKRRKIDCSEPDKSSSNSQMACELPSSKQQIINPEGQNSKPNRTQEEIAILRARTRARQKAAMKAPKLFLTLEELKPKLQKMGEESYILHNERSPLFAMDIQHLLLYAIQGILTSYTPRWCKLLRWTRVSEVVLVVLEGVGMSDYRTHEECFPFLDSAFDMNVDIATPTQYNKSITSEIINVPLSGEKTFKRLYGNDYKKWKDFKTDQRQNVSKMPVILDQSNHQTGFSHLDKGVSRVDILLSSQQMLEDNFPLPVFSDNMPGYKFTKLEYKEVTAESPLFALDCEMCLTTAKKLELTRISIINESMELVYDSLVKPRNPIVNYLTRYSGITKQMLEGVKTRLEDVQTIVQDILPADAILCGQSLNGDLHTIKMFHPYVIDTSVIYNLSGKRKVKTGLRKLTAQFLNRDIQNNPAGHDSSEDAIATLELVKLKLAKGIKFGDVTMGYVPGCEEAYVPETAPVQDKHPTSLLPVVATRPDGNQSENNETTKESKDAQKTIFFTRQGKNALYDNLFTLAKESGKSVVMIDREKELTLHDTKDGSTVCVESDKEAAQQARDKHGQHFCTLVRMTHFMKHAESQDTVKVKEVLQKLDKRVQKIGDSVKENGLFLVVMAGRTTPQYIHNAACFVKIVRAPLSI